MDAIDSPVFCTLSMSLSHNLDISDVVAWDEQKSQMNTVCRKSRVNLHINHQQKKSPNGKYLGLLDVTSHKEETEQCHSS